MCRVKLRSKEIASTSRIKIVREPSVTFRFSQKDPFLFQPFDAFQPLMHSHYVGVCTWACKRVMHGTGASNGPCCQY